MLLVFGSINLDLVVPVAALPRPGETVLGGALATGPGGKGANQAHAARRHGAVVHMVGAVGTDAFAAPALAGLQAAGVHLEGVHRLADAATGVALISVAAAAGENSIVVASGANGRPEAGWVGDAELASARALLLQMEVPAAESLALARRARQAGVPVLLNAAPWPDTLPGGQLPPDTLDWLIVNAGELAQAGAAHGLGPEPVLAADPAGTAVRLARALRCNVLLTLGGAGALLAAADGVAARCDALPVNVVDTTGAGDTCCGVFAAALAEGFAPPAALRRAVAAASLACTRWGAQAAQPTRAELDAALAASG